MSSSSSTFFKTLSMADSCLVSLPSIFSAKSPTPSLSIPSRAVKLHISCAFSTSFSPSLTLRRKKTQFPSIAACVSQDEEENTFNPDQDEVAETEVSDLEGEGWSEAEGGGEESFEDAEDSFPLPSEDAKVFVTNLPYDVDSKRLAMLFEQAGVVEIAEVIYNRGTDRSRGFGFVTMSTVEEAEKAVEKFHRYELDGRLLTVNKASRRGESLERPPPPPRTFTPGFRIYVGNLPWGVDNSRLQQIFSEHGNVVDARVVNDRETGRSRGFGFVTMSSEDEMNSAIASLDGESIDGRTIIVSVAEERARRF